jgi:hypothetical protein
MQGKEKWAALSYEILRLFCERWPWLNYNPVVTALMNAFREDWNKWKVKTTLENVDKQIEDIHRRWDEIEKAEQAPIITEEPPDGSMAQDLLGGEIRIRAPWAEE